MSTPQERIAEAESLVARGLYERAIAAYAQLIEAQPELEHYRFVIGELLFELQRYLDAARTFDVVTQRAPGDPRGWDALGRAYALAGESIRAAAALEHAAMLAPGWPEPRYQAALAYVELGDVARAEAHLRAAIAIDPRFRALALEEGLADVLPSILAP